MITKTDNTPLQQTTADYLHDTLHWNMSVYTTAKTLGKERTLPRHFKWCCVLSGASVNNSMD